MRNNPKINHWPPSLLNEARVINALEDLRILELPENSLDLYFLTFSKEQRDKLRAKIKEILESMDRSL